MPEITAIYEKGVLKPLEKISLFKEHRKVKIFIWPNISWYREFKNLLQKIHGRTAKFNSIEVEKDITLASRQIKKIKYDASKSAY